MRKKCIAIALFIIALPLGAFVRTIIGDFIFPQTALAFGDLKIVWGVPSGSPLFVVASMLPGDTQQKTVTIINDGSFNRTVKVWGDETSNNSMLANVLEIVIKKNNTDVYGGTSVTGKKTLTQFLAESSPVDGVDLGELLPGSSSQYTFFVVFPQTAGNEYQESLVKFTLSFGVKYVIPKECSRKHFDGPPIFGTHKKDKIKGTKGNDLIIGLEGDDDIDGMEGDDCIIGGSGHNHLHGGRGDDVVIGGDEDDDLYGEDGNDELHGGRGRNVCDGGKGENIVFRESDRDTIRHSGGRDRERDERPRESSQRR